jgi:hypothetical protein
LIQAFRRAVIDIKKYQAQHLIIFVIKHRQAIERNMTTPFTLQVRQFTHKFKADLFMALAAGRKGLSPD